MALPLFCAKSPASPFCLTSFRVSNQVREGCSMTWTCALGSPGMDSGDSPVSGVLLQFSVGGLYLDNCWLEQLCN